MISIWKQGSGELVEIGQVEKDCWINVVAPDAEEIEVLRKKYRIPDYFIKDVLDAEERPRSEIDGKWFVLLLRIPVYESGAEVPFQTVPVGVLISRQFTLTLCSRPNAVIEGYTQRKLRNLNLSNRHGFILYLFLRSGIYYSRYIREINRRTAQIEKELEKSSRNHELIRLLNLEKSLVYFITSLRSNELLLEKLRRSKFARDAAVDEDLLEDALIENKQALEMANIYSNILSGMMDAFASVISNNLNVTMKQLTSVTLILMIPTLVASLYGMNVKIPLEGSPHAFWYVSTIAVVLSFVGVYIFRKKEFF